MQELTVLFRPADGGSPKNITLRIGSPEREERSWSALVEVIGFAEPVSRRIYGEDWAQAIELAAKILPTFVDAEVHDAGGGTLDPAFFEREIQSPDLDKLPLK